MIWAKYVGTDVATNYTRKVESHTFTTTTEKIDEATIAVKAAVELVMPGEDEAYDSETPVEQADINYGDAFEFAAKYNSGRAVSAFAPEFTSEEVTNEYRCYLASQPSIGNKKVNDTVALTFNLYDSYGTVVDSVEVIATLVASL